MLIFYDNILLKKLNSDVRSLDLSYNQIGNEEAIEIANVLEENYTLTKIRIDNKK